MSATQPEPAREQFRHPFDPAVRRDPAGAYRWLRTHAPLWADPASGFVFVSRHADCSALLRDRHASAALAQQQRARGTPLPETMLNTDPPRHDELRNPAAALLGAQAVAELASRLDAEIAAVLDGLPADDIVDGVAALGIPFAAAVLGALLEVPVSARSLFARLARDASVNLDPLAGPEAIAEGERATAELSAFLLDHAAPAAASLPLATLMLVVIGGFEPLVSLASTAMYELAGRPDLLALSADPENARRLVDELLRLQSPIPFAARHASADIQLPSGTLPAGCTALALLGAANRDADVFDRPDELRRGGAANAHLAFGAGPHYCLGAPLVRHAGAILLAGVARRFPHLERMPPNAKPMWRRSIVPHALAMVPLRLATRYPP